jgi:23S rRNA pseudouridine2605 synthase
MADAGVASRRECERMIEEGRVEVNGELVTRLPVLVDPRKDKITLDGRPVKIKARGPERVYVMLHKPERILCTTRDETPAEEGGRRTVMDLVDHPSGARLYPVGRLDYHATGIVLLTNDGELTNRLTHARYGVSQTFRIWAAGDVNQQVLDMLRRRVGKRGVLDEQGQDTGGVRVDITPGTELDTGDVSESTVLEITVREGRRESIADMLLASGCPVKKMVRVAVGPLRMRGVGSGKWRDLSREEVALLEDAAFASAPGAGESKEPA